MYVSKLMLPNLPYIVLLACAAGILISTFACLPAQYQILSLNL